MSNQGGRGSTSGPATTAPGESGQTCGQSGCHNGGAFDVAPEIELTDAAGDVVLGYVPGETYTVSLKINHSGLPAGYGFQMVCLTDADNTGVNTFSNFVGDIDDIMLLDRQYVEQKSRLPVDLIPLTWTAPEFGTGDVTFYAAANAVNGNGNSGGDGAGITSTTIVEGGPLSSSDIPSLADISISPNPTADYINIASSESIVAVNIYNTQGQKIISETTDRINVSDLRTGLYIAKVVTGSGEVTRTFVKK